ARARGLRPLGLPGRQSSLACRRAPPCLPPRQKKDRAGKAGARSVMLSEGSSCLAQSFKLVAEFFDVGDVGADGAVVEGADRGAATALGHVENRVEVVLTTVAGDDAVDHLV